MHVLVNSLTHWIFLLVFFFSQTILLEMPQSQWIVWNVGQGQWLTYIQAHNCWHFDFGGEKNPIQEILRYCGWRDNLLILSHADRDHFSFLTSIKNSFKHVCLYGPKWKELSPKRVHFAQIPKCPVQKNEMHFYIPTLQRSHDDNFESQIIHTIKWLIPGDAPKSIERRFVRHATQLNSISHLLLGHHGSKTSSSIELLDKLPNLIQCIGSSRKKKYGHPHREVLHRLHTRCSLLTTENWHHIHFFESISATPDRLDILNQDL